MVYYRGLSEEKEEGIFTLMIIVLALFISLFVIAIILSQTTELAKYTTISQDYSEQVNQ